MSEYIAAMHGNEVVVMRKAEDGMYRTYQAIGDTSTWYQTRERAVEIAKAMTRLGIHNRAQARKRKARR